MKEKLRFLGLDVHAETITVAVAEPDGDVRSLGTIPNRAESIRKLIKKLGPADKLRACYEAGPTGYVVYWQLAELGVECEVVAPTLVPVKAGDRVKTDRRDAEKLWRAQVEAFATEGWHCIAPDMRGYGGSSAPSASEAYALKEIVDDMVELHDHLGASPAIWVGHDLGSPVGSGRWPRITRSEAAASCLSLSHMRRKSSRCPTSCRSSTASSIRPTIIRTDNGTTTVSI